jgi:aminoglycoside phosphotransferase (APT) family kinase protein
VESYATTAGIAVDHIDFFYAFANFKFAVITQGIAARVASGAMGGQHFGSTDEVVIACAQAGIAALDRRH